MIKSIPKMVLFDVHYLFSVLKVWINFNIDSIEFISNFYHFSVFVVLMSFKTTSKKIEIEKLLYYSTITYCLIFNRLISAIGIQKTTLLLYFSLKSEVKRRN